MITKLETVKNRIERGYKLACESCSALGLDLDPALKILQQIRISLHCWQGDDVGASKNSAALSVAAWLSPAIIPAKPAAG